MSNIDFSIPQRQSWRGLILFFSISLKNIIKAIWPVVILFLFKQNSINENRLIFVYLIITFFFILIAANTILYFMNFFFYIKEKELIIEKGFLKKIKILIPLDKIQTINTKQNILQQFLKVVTLEIDTAGSSQKEAKFISLTKETAEDLQKYLSKFTAAKNQEFAENENTEHKINKNIINLSITDLFKIGLSENHLKTLVLIYLFLSGIYQQLKDIFSNAVDVASKQAGGFIENSGAFFISFLIIISLFFLIAFSILMVILKYFDLNFSRQEGAFLLKSGLLNKKDILIPYSKIQIISWSSNPIRKIMNFVSVHIVQASNIDLNKKQAIIIPGCRQDHLENIQKEIFINNQDVDWTLHKSHPVFFIRLWIIRILVLAIPLILMIPDYWETYFFVGVWVVISGLLSYISYTKRWFKITKKFMQISKGCVGQEFSMMFNYKIQCVKYNQTFFQRRRKTASVSVYTSGGKMLYIPYLQQDIAFELYNYLLYATESSHEKWM